MMACRWTFVFHTSLLILRLVTAQVPSITNPQDVVTYYCSRWFHQAVIKNDALYLYGGIQTYNVPNLTVKSQNNTLGYNPFLLEIDLTNSWDWKTNISWISLGTESNSRSGDYPRHGMTNGALYHGSYNTTSVWAYSGTTFRGNSSFLNSDKVYTDKYPLWSYENSTRTWDQFELGQLKVPSHGLSTEAPDQGLAFYLHGQTDNGTEPYTRDTGDHATLLNGMMVLDLVHQTAKNISTSSMVDPQPRIGGSMTYVPTIGENGILVALGGQVFDGERITTSQDKGRLITFDTVDIFDVGSYVQNPGSNGQWYQQETTGEIPPPRIDSCAVVASAPDNSSHNIWMFAGWDPTKPNTWYDDVYVLSIPTFTWVKMYWAESPRYGHTCHVLGRQLLTTGGRNIRRNITDYCDWNLQGIAVLDMNTMTWGSVWNSTYDDFAVPTLVVDKIGGTPQGGARDSPSQGWSSPEFLRLMNTTRIYSNITGTIDVIRPPGPAGLSSQTKTAITISVIVVGVVLLLLIVVAFIYRRRRLRAKGLVTLDENHASAVEIDEKEKYELEPESKDIHELYHEEPNEAPDTLVRAEADRAHVSVQAVELPATNFGAEGRWGIPTIQEPTPSDSRRGSAATSFYSCRVTLSSRRSSREH